MMKPEYLLRGKKKVEAPAADVPPLPQQQVMPFRMGDVLLTDAVKRDLQVLGWKQGDPLPGDLPQRISAARQAAADEINRELAKTAQSGQELVLPQEIPLDKLPPAHRQSILQAMSQAKQDINYAELHRQEMAALGQLAPSVQQAILASRGGSPVEVFDSREEAVSHDLDAETPDVQAPPAGPPTSLLRPPKSPPPPPPPQPPPFRAAEAPAAADKSLTNCPHCNWLLSREDDAKPSANDLLAYEAATLGDQPFVKRYALLKGQVHVTFRDLTVVQAEAVFHQVACDQAAGRIATLDDVLRKVQSYRTALALVQVNVRGRLVNVAAEVDDVLAKPEADELLAPGETPLPHIVKRLTQTPPMHGESFWRALGATWRRFNRLVEHLEARMDDESF